MPYWISLCSRCALLLVTLLCSGLSTRPGFLGNLQRLVSLEDPRLLALVRLAPLMLPRLKSSRLLLLPRASLARGRRKAKLRLPFPLPPEAPAAREVKVRGPGRSLPDGELLPMRVGGCLSLHWRQWQAIGAETWVVTVLRDGYRVPFTDSPPPLARTPVSFPMYRAGSPRAQALRQEVEAMLAKGALEIARDPGPGFYSRLFLVEKATGGWRPVIDLSHLNDFVQLTSFKMETVASVLLSVREGDFLASLDLKDAYFQIPIHGSSRKLLRFMSEEVSRYDHRYQCRQGFPVSSQSREIPFGSGEILFHAISPGPALAGDSGSPGFAGTVGSSRSSSDALLAVASEDASVPRVRPSLASGGFAGGSETGSVLVDGEGSPVDGGSIRDTAPDLHLYSDTSSSGWGAHLLDQNVSGVWSDQEKLLHINLLEMKALFLGLQAFQEDVSGHHVTAMCDNSTVVAYVNKQGGTVSRALCLLTSRLLRWTESFDVHLDARYLPGESNVLADVLSRRGQVVGTEWSLHPQVARALLRAWGNPSIDLFATCLNAKLPLYCSLVPDPQAVFEDAFRHPWDDLDLYAFPPFPLVSRVIARVQQSSRVAMTLVAPLWPEKEWFADLLLLLTQPPLALPCWENLLRQPHCSLFHQGVHALKLHAWRLSSDTTESRAFREELLESCQGSSESPPLDCTSRDGRSSVVGVVEGALLQSTPLFL